MPPLAYGGLPSVPTMVVLVAPHPRGWVSKASACAVLDMSCVCVCFRPGQNMWWGANVADPQWASQRN